MAKLTYKKAKEINEAYQTFIDTRRNIGSDLTYKLVFVFPTDEFKSAFQLFEQGYFNDIHLRYGSVENNNKNYSVFAILLNNKNEYLPIDLVDDRKFIEGQNFISRFNL
ncbi:MAG: hypothetical protein WCP65_00435 [Bacteroidota bacterium]